MQLHLHGSGISPDELGGQRIGSDWFGQKVDPPIEFAFGIDPEFFHFTANREAPANGHPEAPEGSFQSGLWQYDVAEFFLRDPVTGHYLEFNLAPHGAWWACVFRAPREAVKRGGERLPGVATTGACGREAWRASASIPLALLRDRFHFGPGSRLDATFIIDSPAQRFLCASEPSEGAPDFHRPDAWLPVEVIPMP